jgi:hypothetical protein
MSRQQTFPLFPAASRGQHILYQIPTCHLRQHPQRNPIRQPSRATGSLGSHETILGEIITMFTPTRRIKTFNLVALSPAVHLGDLVTLLAQHRPGVYGHLDPTALGSMLRSLGVGVGTVWDPAKPRDKASGKGIQREWLDKVWATAYIGAEAEERHLRSVSS